MTSLLQIAVFIMIFLDNVRCEENPCHGMLNPVAEMKCDVKRLLSQSYNEVLMKETVLNHSICNQQVTLFTINRNSIHTDTPTEQLKVKNFRTQLLSYVASPCRARKLPNMKFLFAASSIGISGYCAKVFAHYPVLVISRQGESMSGIMVPNPYFKGYQNMISHIKNRKTYLRQLASVDIDSKIYYRGKLNPGKSCDEVGNMDRVRAASFTAIGPISNL